MLAGGCGAAAPPDRPPQVLRVTVAIDGLVPEVATGVATGDDRVLTVAHALSGAHAVRVAGHRARVIRIDRRLDLALLAVPGLRAPAVRLGEAVPGLRSPAVRRGDPVPGLRAPAVRLGGDARRVAIVVLRDRRVRSLPGRVRRRVLVRWRDQPIDPARSRPGLELAATIEPGDSGAPVVDRRGRLLGVLYARSRDGDATAWAVDGSAVRTLLAR
jgi:S1-C subfamily serine protease